MGQRKVKGPFRRESTVLTTIVATAIVLGILVFVHEFGHFVLAKKLGVSILKFSLGFGPKLIGKKIGETEYQIAVFPLGGFVKPLGEDRHEEIKEEDRPRSLWAQPIWKRALIVSAGPFFNFLLTILIFTFVNPFAIFPTETTPMPAVISNVSPGLPAERAGLKKGDVILSVDGKNISTWDELSKIIRNSGGKDLTLKVRRGNEIFEKTISPLLTKEGGQEIYRIGIVSPQSYPKVGPKYEFGNGFVRTGQVVEITVLVFVKILQGEISTRDALGGPIAIAQMAGEQARKGFVDLLYLIGILGVSLGIINLLPIPVLDGGHILFLVIETFLKKPLSLKKMEIAQQMGLILIILLMLFAFYNDLIRLFTRGGFKF